jgi:XTP/dITP diphosphohydrolase
MPSKRNIIVIATRNQGKVREFEQLFQPLHWDVQSMADFAGIPEVIEDGTTFAANAWIKAKTIAETLQLPVLADDSGLCVDALAGGPGVWSARYAGEHASDQDNNEKLLQALESNKVLIMPGAEDLNAASSTPAKLASDHPELLSKANFTCALALYDPQQMKILQVEGTCDGYILSKARGSLGFGYDPLFYLPVYRRSMAELTTEEKNTISHRAVALRNLLGDKRSRTFFA